MKSASVSTRVTWQQIPSFSSVSTRSSASRRSSSRCRKRNGDFIFGLVSPDTSWWRLVDDGPENPQFLDGVDEGVKIHRLDDIGIHAQLIARHHVPLFTGRSKHHHGNHPEFFV